MTVRLHSTDPGWKPNIDVQPLLDFAEGLILDLARTHPHWTQAHSAEVLARVALGRKHGHS
jgi:hypothetical protein